MGEALKSDHELGSSFKYIEMVNSVRQLTDYKEIDETKFKGTIFLLENALANVKFLYGTSMTLRDSNCSLKQELETTSLKCCELEKTIDKLQTQCQKCHSLEESLVRSNKKVKELESRISSIASILNLGGSNQNKENAQSNAFNLVSQMLLGDSPKGKLLLPRYTPSLDRTEVLLVPATNELTQTDVNKKCEEPAPMAPKESPRKQESPEKKLTKGISTSFELCDKVSSPPPTPPRKNLSAEFSTPRNRKRKTVTPDTTPKKSINFNIKPFLEPHNSPSKTPQSTLLDKSLADFVQGNHDELDKIWFNESPAKSTRSKAKSRASEPSEYWKLEQSIEIPAAEKSGKRLKQMKLSVGSVQRKIDISAMEPDLEEESQEIIMPSPNVKKTQSRAPLTVSNNSESHKFAPLATSTQAIAGPSAETDPVQKPSAQKCLDSSFDRVPKKSDSPDYKYKRGAVKKKAERAKLDGWDCDLCAKYYEGLQLNSTELKKRKNQCSRHRDKWNPNTNTPPGFWDPRFPSTQELKDQGVYKSIVIERPMK